MPLRFPPLKPCGSRSCGRRGCGGSITGIQKTGEFRVVNGNNWLSLLTASKMDNEPKNAYSAHRRLLEHSKQEHTLGKSDHVHASGIVRSSLPCRPESGLPFFTEIAVG